MILCITHSNDTYTIDRVLEYFEQKNKRALRLNTDQLLIDLRIEKIIGEKGWDIVVKTEGGSFSLSEISGVWFRKVWPPKVLEEIDTNYRANVASEINASLFGFFGFLESHVPCINRWSMAKKVDGDKFLQLCEAKKAGLVIPNTIITSDFERVRTFYEEQDGNIIVKLHNALSFSMGAGDRFFPTKKVAYEDLAELKDSLECCPMIFQSNIPKAYELRVVYIDGTCFAGKINTSVLGGDKQDWRYSNVGQVFWEHYTLPESEVNKIDELMKSLELSFGAIDIICQPDGNYVFLEVNPSGEWGMLQRDLGYPIAETIAQKLLKRIENHEK